MNLKSPVLGDVQHICLNLRYQDEREVWALRADEPTKHARLDLARIIHACSIRAPWAQVAGLDEPIAVFVAVPRTPTTCDALFVATDRWREIGRAFTRHALRVIWPALIGQGIARVEARVWCDHRARRWVEALGAERELTIEGYGKNGETYVQYARNAA